MTSHAYGTGQPTRHSVKTMCLTANQDLEIMGPNYKFCQDFMTLGFSLPHDLNFLVKFMICFGVSKFKIAIAVMCLRNSSLCKWLTFEYCIWVQSLLYSYIHVHICSWTQSWNETWSFSWQWLFAYLFLCFFNIHSKLFYLFV